MRLWFEAVIAAALFGQHVVDAHSWVEKVESAYGAEGASRVGMTTKSDSYLQRYFCPKSTLEECQPDPKHNIVLDATALRPCRPDLVSDPKAVVEPGTVLTLHWAGNGHVGNGQSDGTCVKVMVAPYESDPSFDSFVDIPGAECLDFWITASDGSQQPQGEIVIPATLAEGNYTMLWYWGFTEFWYSSCIDVEVVADAGGFTSTPPPTPAIVGPDEGEVQVYLHNGCGDVQDPTGFCQQYTTIPESYCLSDVDECGRSICYGVGNFLLPCPSVCPVGCPVPKAFYDNFSDGLDEANWLVAEKSWGGGSNGFTNGGVVAVNVVANATAGTVVFNAHGNDYTGDVMGINKDLSRQSTGVRTGGAIASRRYFGPGSYEVRMKVAAELGVCSAIWTFFYNDDDFCADDDPIVNHEIDIELPGRPAAPATGMDFEQALLNTWVGELGSLYDTGYTALPLPVDDGIFHTWRFDWHTDSAERRVEFFLDGQHLRTMTNHIPFYAGRLWLGAWFPNAWAGEPNFDEAQMEVDYFKFTPFDEAFECPAESYPDFGWAPGTDVTLPNSVMCGSYTPSPATPSPTQPPTPAITNAPVAGSYLDHGCANLPDDFCSTHCKDWQQDDCGRSVCHGDSHSSLNPCPDTPSPVSPNPTQPPTPLPVSPNPTKPPTPLPVSSSPTQPPTPLPVSPNPTQPPTPLPVSLSPSQPPTPLPVSSSPTQPPTPLPVSSSPTQPPTTAVTTSSPVGGNYLDDGCANLPPTFCAGYMNISGSYCKDNQADECGRSICHRDIHSSLNECGGNSDELEAYLSGGCVGLSDSFCGEYNGGYCKHWQADQCGRSVCHGDNHSSLNAC